MKKVVITSVVALLLGVGAAVAGVKAPKRNKSPYIARDERSYDRCGRDDANAPCYGRRIAIFNPLPKHVAIRLSCVGESFKNERAIILPRRYVIFDIGTGNGSMFEGQCEVVEWKIWNGGSLE